MGTAQHTAPGHPSRQPRLGREGTEDASKEPPRWSHTGAQTVGLPETTGGPERDVRHSSWVRTGEAPGDT